MESSGTPVPAPGQEAHHGDSGHDTFFLVRCREAAGASSPGDGARRAAGRGVAGGVGGGRGRGRGDYPVRAMWRALVAGVVFGHRSAASLVRELGRNPALLAVCGFDPLPRQGRPRRGVERVEGGSRVVWLSAPRRDSVPSHWNFSRFVRRLVDLERREGVFEAMMRRMGEELREALPDFGEHPRFRGGRFRGTTGRRFRATRPVGCRVARGSCRTAMRTGAVTRREEWMGAPVGRGRR